MAVPIYLEKIIIPKDTYTLMFIAVVLQQPGHRCNLNVHQQRGIEHRVALQLAVGHFLLVRHAVFLGELAAFLVVDAEVAFALDLFTHEGDGVDVDLDFKGL